MISRNKAANRFPGLELSSEDRAALKVLGRQRLSARVWRRVRILQLLDDGWTLADTAAAAGTYPREVRRVGQRFLRGGLSEALGEDARPKQGADARCSEGGRHRRDGLRPAAAGAVSLDDGADSRGGHAPKGGRQGRARNDSADADAPRAEAVASTSGPCRRRSATRAPRSPLRSTTTASWRTTGRRWSERSPLACQARFSVPEPLGLGNRSGRGAEPRKSKGPDQRPKPVVPGPSVGRGDRI